MEERLGDYECMSTTVLEPGPARRPGLGLLILLGGMTAFAPMGIDMYLPAMPAMAETFGATTADVQITLAAFLAGMAGGQLLYGSASDRLGRRGPLLFGAALFTLASIACAYAPMLEALAGLRFLQALGGCAGVVVARAVVRDRHNVQEAAGIFTMLMLVMGVAPIVAPFAGSMVLSAFDWRGVFWALAAFGTLIGISAYFALPESRPDWVAQRARAESPFHAYWAVLQNREFLRYAVVGSLSSASLFAFISSAPHLFMEVFEVSPQRFSLFFGANAAGIIGATQLNQVFLRFFPSQRILRGALAAGVVMALVLVGVSASGVGGMWGVLFCLFVTLSLSMLASPNALALAMGAEQVRAGAASALMGSMQFASGAGTSAVMGIALGNSAAPLGMGMAILLGLASLVLLLMPTPGPARHPE